MVTDNQATAAETVMTRKPPFRADHVGSLIRSPKLIEAHTAYLQGKMPISGLRELEDAAITDAIAMQERVGLAPITDGELRRNNWRDRFFEKVDGFSKDKVESSFIFTDYDDEVVWKDGWTGGFTCFIGFSTRSGRGTIVITDVGNCDDRRDRGDVDRIPAVGHESRARCRHLRRHEHAHRGGDRGRRGADVQGRSVWPDAAVV